MKPPYKIPTGWSKGEPLVVTKKGETCYQLTRSGGYLDVPGARFTPGSVSFLEFESRVAMVEFQKWWDLPESDDTRHKISRAEYLEYVQELLEFHPRRGVAEHLIPGLGPEGRSLYVEVSESEAKMLREYHSRYCAEVAQVLNIRE